MTNAAGANRHPSWSPDDRSIAFESNRNGNWDIYVIDLSTGDELAITKSRADDRYPSWSPDGRHIAFVSNRDGEPDIYLTEPVTGTVTRRISLSGVEEFPAWSPDAREVVFTSTVGSVTELRAVGMTDGAPSTLFSDTSLLLWPRWSPDGSTVAFFSRRDTRGDGDEIYLLALATGDLRRLTQRPGHDFTPAWNPSSSHLVFVRVGADGSRGLSVVEIASGKHVHEMATDYFRVSEPAWSTDGSRIVCRTSFRGWHIPDSRGRRSPRRHTPSRSRQYIRLMSSLAHNARAGHRLTTHRSRRFPQPAAERNPRYLATVVSPDRGT